MKAPERNALRDFATGTGAPFGDLLREYRAMSEGKRQLALREMRMFEAEHQRRQALGPWGRAWERVRRFFRLLTSELRAVHRRRRVRAARRRRA